MALFGKKKNRENACCCGDFSGAAMARAEENKRPGGVKVLGSGCAKCRALEKNVRDALRELGMEPAVDHVTDPAGIAAYGVMTTPALVVNGTVVSLGRVLSREEAAECIRKALQA